MLKTHLGGLAKPNEVEAPGAGDAAKGCRLPKLVVYLVRGGERSGSRASTEEKGEGAGTCGSQQPSVVSHG